MAVAGSAEAAGTFEVVVGEVVGEAGGAGESSLLGLVEAVTDAASLGSLIKHDLNWSFLPFTLWKKENEKDKTRQE